MSKLQSYLDQRVNFWRVNVDKKAPITVSTMTLQDAESVRDSLCGDASPENVTCDGECSHSEVRRKMTLYRAAATELMKRFPQMSAPQYDDGDLFSAPVVVPRGQFTVGQSVAVDHPQLGGRQTGFIVKVNRVKCLVEFTSKRKYHIPMEMIQII